MSATMTQEQVGWRLALEPSLQSLSWSLICARGRASGHAAAPVVDHQVWAGRHDQPGPWRALVERLTPRGDAVWDGLLADPHEELALARELGSALLPPALRDALTAGGDATHTLTIATRGWCAAIPWDALVVDAADTRLLERCRILIEAHPLAGIDRQQMAQRRPPPPGEPDGLTILDPGPVVDDDPALAPLYPAGPPPELRSLGGTADHVLAEPAGLGSRRLGELLRQRRWSRLLYAGHISPGSGQDPGTVALVLAEGMDTDLLSAYSWLEQPRSWPAPERVALIGCGSGDGRPVEDVGLVLAAMRAGAELVTASRWTLPADLSPTERNFTRLVQAVHAAHVSPDPVGHLREWQLTELHRWRASRYAVHAPLTWAAPMTVIAPGGRESHG